MQSSRVWSSCASSRDARSRRPPRRRGSRARPSSGTGPSPRPGRSATSTARAAVPSSARRERSLSRAARRLRILRSPMSYDWEHVKHLFYEVLQEDPQRRAVRLDACGGDADLRRELESLLAAYESDPGFIEAPVLARRDLPFDELAGGARLGPYRLQRPLGFGG